MLARSQQQSPFRDDAESGHNLSRTRHMNPAKCTLHCLMIRLASPRQRFPECMPEQPDPCVCECACDEESLRLCDALISRVV